MFNQLKFLHGHFRTHQAERRHRRFQKELSVCFSNMEQGQSVRIRSTKTFPNTVAGLRNRTVGYAPSAGTPMCRSVS
ncbi:MAG: hypothetical protein R2788_12495 [Saprospiraceae bacterium]